MRGVLPRHYTEILLRLDRERRDAERHSLRDWLDLFNHRFSSLFYRAWEKYRLFLEPDRRRGTAGLDQEGETGPFEANFLSLIGLGTPALRNRLVVEGAVVRPPPVAVAVATFAASAARIDDSTLIFHAGLVMHRTRSATGLEAILREHFRLGVEVVQFQGRWLHLDRSSQSRLEAGWNAGNRLGVNAVLGERVWDIQGMFRLRVGLLSYREFTGLLPDRTPARPTRAAFLMAQLVRSNRGPELEFDIQLVLKAAEVPPCVLPTGATEGPILGWNSWLANDSFTADADDAAFANSFLGV